jgi:hypothetical protein
VPFTTALLVQPPVTGVALTVGSGVRVAVAEAPGVYVAVEVGRGVPVAVALGGGVLVPVLAGVAVAAPPIQVTPTVFDRGPPPVMMPLPVLSHAVN